MDEVQEILGIRHQIVEQAFNSKIREIRLEGKDVKDADATELGMTDS